MDMNFIWNQWYATLTATQFSMCMFVFVYMKWHKTRASLKFIKVYLLVQCLFWFLDNLSFVQIISIDKAVWETMESVTRTALLIIFYRLLSPKALENDSVIIGLSLLALFPVILVWIKIDSSMHSMVRVLSGSIGFVLSFAFYRYLYRQLSAGSLVDYHLFLFNSAFFLRSGGILWFTMLIALYSPDQFIDLTLLDISFSVLAILECLILFFGIIKQKSRNRYV